jgi:hypothetical protein
LRRRPALLKREALLNKGRSDDPLHHHNLERELRRVLGMAIDFSSDFG